MSPLWCTWPQEVSRDVSADAGALCDKGTVLRDMIKGTFVHWKVPLSPTSHDIHSTATRVFWGLDFGVLKVGRYAEIDYRHDDKPFTPEYPVIFIRTFSEFRYLQMGNVPNALYESQCHWIQWRQPATALRGIPFTTFPNPIYIYIYISARLPRLGIGQSQGLHSPPPKGF